MPSSRSIRRLIFGLGFFGALSLGIAEPSTVVLQDAGSSIAIDPATLKMVVTSKEHAPLELSAGKEVLGKISNLENDENHASWVLDETISITVSCVHPGLLVHIVSQKEEAFTFPRIRQTDAMRGWILPMFEGVYAPVSDGIWHDFLTNAGDLNTTADFGLPFLATHQDNLTVTYIFTNQFNNRVRFVSTEGNGIEAKVTHDFTRNQPVKEYGVLIRIGNSSPVEPARIYRDWLKQSGEFVTLREKIARTPEAAKLLGAAHAYVWGDGPLAPTDISDWKQFMRGLNGLVAVTNDSAAGRIYKLFEHTTRETINKSANEQWIDNYSKSVVIDDLNRLLSKEDFSNAPAAGKLRPHSKAELIEENSEFLRDAFPGLIAPFKSWGAGVSPKMVEKIASAGIDRLVFLTADRDGLENLPETVAAAKKAGWLIGPYDSYDSVHPPGMKDTWETAQFDQKLYDTGAIIKEDGTKRHGFQKKGYHLSPIAARPYVERRVSGLMDEFHANAWFMDCDGFGDFFDDYSPVHPATQQSDMAARISRMAWIRDTFGAVIGTEGCTAGVAATVHFAHGVMTPVIGWGDQDLADKSSPYFLGKYYPPDEPQVFFKPVSMKEKYQRLYFDPRFRLPLFETVFHDSVVATHHWSFGSFKTKDLAKTVELLELLYQIPPLYHLNPAEFKKREAAIAHHYQFFSPLHRQTGLMAMTDFKWLTPDRTVQESSFGGEVDLVANFGAIKFQWEKLAIQPDSIGVKWRKTGEVKIYMP